MIIQDSGTIDHVKRNLREHWQPIPGRGIVTLALLCWLLSAASGQQLFPANPASSTPHFGIPQDWSNQHVIYTRNGSPEDLLKFRNDPRLLNSILLHYRREHRNQTGQTATVGLNEAGLNEAGWDEDSLSEDTSGTDTTEGLQPLAPWDQLEYRPLAHLKNKHSKVDWSVSLGPTAGMAFGETPGVYTYNYSTPSCSDFVVYTINAAAAVGTQANLVGLANLYTDGAGTGYCTGTTPSFLFSYAIGTGGSPLSPVLSLDGTRVAWIENRTATSSYLHITIWVANQGISATYPVAVTGAFLNGGCNPVGSSCDDAIEYTAATYPGCPTEYIAANGHSDLYVDYASDAGYISANNGLLYHIKNIFSTTTSPSVDFCIPVNAAFETAPSSAMSGPIYDQDNNEVFITDSENIYAYIVNASATTPNFAPASPASYTYGNSASNHNYQTGPGPLLDAFNGYIYVFSTYDANSKTSVTQLPTSLASAVAVELGPESTNANPMLFYGAFDNNYFTYGPKNAASTLYSCGTDSTTTNAQDLFSISFNPATGVVNTTPAMSYNKNVNPGGAGGPGVLNGLCSPLTEFYDGTNDRLFVGMGEQGAASGANVVTMWNVNTQLTNTSGSGGTIPTYTAEATGYLGGASGISADNNDSGTSQAESIYFSTEDAGSSSTAVTGGYNYTGIYTNGTHFPQGAGMDDDGNAYSYTELGATQTWNGTTFTFGTPNVNDVWSNTTITLPANSFSTLEILAAAVNGNQTAQTFTVNYTDGTTTTFTQSFSDWYTGPMYYPNESVAVTMAYENTYNGGERVHATYIYGYSYGINAAKTVKSLTLPANRDVVVMAVALATNCGGADYCAVKLTQTGLQ
jgi:hypothetical protein